MDDNIKLPEDFKAKWVAALRSGEYKQGRLRLHNADNTYCCLGVAATICGVDMNIYGSHASIAERAEQQVYGSPLNVPVELSDNRMLQKRLWSMNDMENKSFLEIADYIEQNL